ncbi:MAG TPA: radical SAM family heme chaperone HemW [Fibrobacteria bacterium]|nr:radical SAM family heme chaperone HemW [Fibrobacteria bacterium]
MSLSLYVHVPFCERKCAYCDFASWADRGHEEPAWLGRIERELELRGSQANGPVSSVFFGGGTPSALSEGGLERLCRAVQDNFRLEASAEWSMEANPVSLTREKLEIATGAGVNRVSLGVQSFEPALLSRMGRAHDADQARAALDLVAASGLRWSADLIFALPGQTLEQFLSSLDTLLSWNPSHVSFYGLTLEAGTDFWKEHEAGTLSEAHEDLYADMYLRGVQRLAEAQIHRYEVSNFARPGEECRHNEAYWDTRSTWLAAGNAAHGYAPHLRWRNPRGLSAWYDWADQGFPLEGLIAEDLDTEQRWTEEWFLGLRQAQGVDLSRLAGEFPKEPSRAAIARRIAAGHVEVADDRVRLVGEGWLLLDAIAVEFSA